MPGRVVFFLQRGSYEAAYQAASLGITAAAMGDEVYFVLAFDALRQWVRGTLGHPQTEKEVLESTRAEGLGLPPPHRMLEEAKALGAKFVACDTTLKICGLATGDVMGKLNEIIGLATIWNLTDGARVLTF